MKATGSFKNRLAEIVSAIKSVKKEYPQKGEITEEFDNKLISMAKKKALALIEERNQEEYKEHSTPVKSFRIKNFSDFLTHSSFLSRFSPVKIKEFSLIYKKEDKANSLFLVKKGKVKLFKYDKFQNEVAFDFPQENEYFGLTSFFSKKRTSYAFAMTEVELIEINYSIIEKIIDRFPNIKKDLIFRYRIDFLYNELVNCGLFRLIPIEDRKKIVSYFDVEKYQKDQLIIREGNFEDRSLRIISSGQVSVFTSIQNREIFLNELYEGDYFGEISYLKGIPHTASIKASSNVKIISVSKEKLDLIVKKFPQVLDTLENTMDYRLNEKERILKTGKKSVVSTNPLSDSAPQLSATETSTEEMDFLPVALTEKTLSPENSKSELSDGTGNNPEKIFDELLSTFLSGKLNEESAFERLKNIKLMEDATLDENSRQEKVNEVEIPSIEEFLKGLKLS